MSSPWKDSTDNPSKQLLRELGLQTADWDRELQSRLDQAVLEREKLHRLALEAAAAEHERILESAERTQEYLQLQEERERLRVISQEKEALERARQEKVEREIADVQREILEARRLEEIRAAAAEARRAQVEEEERISRERQKEAKEEAQRAAARKKQEKDEQDRISQESRRKKEEETARNSHQLAPAQGAAAITSYSPAHALPTGDAELQTTISDREAVHSSFVSLHQRLKEMRKFVLSKAAANPSVKKRLGDMRREIKKSVGQLTEGKGANVKPLTAIRNLLREAANMHDITLDVRSYIVSQTVPEVEPAAAQLSGPLIYLLNMFAKFVMSQFVDEAGVAPKTADPIGIVAITVFSATEFRWRGLSLIDILICKFHVLCPVLFGIYGNDKTEKGRKRLGWKFDQDMGNWVSEQRHGERMTGLGSGFAAVSLRDFSNAKIESPFPPSNYWQALARIVNTPANEVTDTHYLVLKAMLEFYVPKVIHFFGSIGLAAVNMAVIEFPKKLPKSVAASAVSTLPATFRRDLHLTLPLSNR